MPFVEIVAMRLRSLLPQLVCACLLLACVSVSHALVILQYHHISDRAPVSARVTPQQFAAHLRFIEENNFRVVDISVLGRLLGKKKNLPDGAVIITFDDGYRSIYQEAYPELKKRKWPFAVFVNSRDHDAKNPLYMSWEQLREMSKNGATIASHTDSHLHMIRKKPNERHSAWSKRMTREIDFAADRIANEIGISKKFFSYPYGEYNGDLVKLLKGKGYLAFGQQGGPVGMHAHPQVIPRFSFSDSAGGDITEFSAWLFSLPFPITNVETESDNKVRFHDPELPVGVVRPRLRITTPISRYVKNFQCFTSSLEKIPTTVQSGSILLQSARALPFGRSHYYCTAHSGGGRLYWYSRLFIRKKPNGSWAVD